MRTTAAMTRTKVFTTATLRSPAARKCLNISAPTRHKRSESEPNPRRRVRANATDGKAWADRFLAQSSLIRVSKPMRKVLQFRAFSACQQSNGYCKYASAKLVFSQPPVRLGSFERHRVHTAVCIADLGLSSVAKTSLSAPVYPKVRWQPGVYALFDPALRRCGKLYHPQVVLKVRVTSGQLDLNVTS